MLFCDIWPSYLPCRGIVKFFLRTCSCNTETKIKTFFICLDSFELWLFCSVNPDFSWWWDTLSSPRLLTQQLLQLIYCGELQLPTLRAKGISQSSDGHTFHGQLFLMRVPQSICMWVRGCLTNVSFRESHPYSDLWFHFISSDCHAVCRASIAIFYLQHLIQEMIGCLIQKALWYL